MIRHSMGKLVATMALVLMTTASGKTDLLRIKQIHFRDTEGVHGNSGDKHILEDKRSIFQVATAEDSSGQR
jgi:hypothetical protein